MRRKTLILSLVAFVVAASFLPTKGFASGLDQEPVVFDMVTFKELDQKAQAIWNSLVREKGSEQAALQAIYLQGAKPDPRLQELHFEMTQLLDSSAFSKREVERLNLEMSGLTRFVLANISLHYGKYIVGNAKLKNRTWISYLRPQADDQHNQGTLVDCAVDAEYDSYLTEKGCMNSYGLAMNILARKAGRAALFSMVSMVPFGYGKAKKEDGTSVCPSILNKSAQLQILSLHQHWFGWRYAVAARENNFLEVAKQCEQDLSETDRNLQKNLLTEKYNSTWRIADAYFPNDDVK